MIVGTKFELPPGWTAPPFGEVAEIKAGGAAPQGAKYFEGGVHPFVRVQHFDGLSKYVGRWDLITEEAVVAKRLKLFPKETILFPKSGASIRLEKRAKLPVDSYVVSHLCCVLPKAIDNDFLYYWLKLVRFAQSSDGSTLPYLNLSEISKQSVPLPPLPEQKKIAHILSTVQGAIEAQERIIQTTTELKKVLMQKLFTEGLRGEPQKQTEIGLVPESWEVVPLSECAFVQTGIAKGRKMDPDDAIELPYLRVANVQDGYLDLAEMKNITIRKKELERFALQEGDVVLTEGGDFDKLGRGFIWHGQIENCVHQNHVFAVRPNKSLLSSEFFAYQSQSPYGKRYFLSVAHKTTNLACINTTKLKAFPVVLPSRDEQQEIVNACESINGKIRTARVKESKLQDLFHTLLHELMTASIRVHELELEIEN